VALQNKEEICLLGSLESYGSINPRGKGRREDNIKMDIREIGKQDVNWTQQPQERTR
jgi:hypothetical protein